MNSKRKLISCILTLAMVLALIPAFSVTAFAGTNETITTPLDFTDETTQAEYATEKNGVRWDSEYNSLILNGATIDCSSNAVSNGLVCFALKLPDYADITLEDGTVNTIKAGPTTSSSVGIYTQGKLYIYGAGTLNVTSYQGDCFLSMGINAWDLEISDSTVVSTGIKHGIYVPYYDLEIENANVTAIATSNSQDEGFEPEAVYCQGEISLDVDSCLSACNSAGLPNTIVTDRLSATGADITSGGVDVTFDDSTFKEVYSQNGTNPILITFPDICVMDGINYKSLDAAIEAAGTTPASITLTKDVVVGNTIDIYGGQDITLDLDGHIIYPGNDMLGSAFYNSGKFTLKDSNSSSAQYEFYEDEDTGLWIQGTGENGETPITVNGGCITGFKVDDSDYISYTDGAVDNHGEMIFESGSIVGNMLYYGGGICSFGDSNSLTMNGGQIAGNIAVVNDNESYGYGGGVYIGEGTFTMNAGEIKNNQAYEYGGGVYVGEDALLVINGGSIAENNAKYGGGVYVTNDSPRGQMKMFGGTIENNTVENEGGGVYNRGKNIILGGTAVINNNYITSTLENAVAIPNNLYLDSFSMIEFGTGTSAPAIQTMKIGVTRATKQDGLSGYIVAQDADADYSNIVTADEYGCTITDTEEDSKHQLGLSIPTYTLIFEKNKVYRDSVDAANDITGQMITRGLEFIEDDIDGYDTYIIADKSFIFESKADISVEFKGKTYIHLTDYHSFYVYNYSTEDNALAVKADQLDLVQGNCSNVILIASKSDTALKCNALNTELNYEGDSASIAMSSEVSAIQIPSEIDADTEWYDFNNWSYNKAYYNSNLKTYVTEANGTTPCDYLIINPEYKTVVTPTYYGGDDSSTTSITASATDVSGTTLNATAKVSGSTANITIKDADLNKMAAQAVTESGNPTGITLDLSKLSGVTAFSLDKTTVDKINSVIADKTNDIEQLDIKLPGATVMLYKEALEGIASQAKGGKIEFALTQGSKAEKTMNDAQKETVKGFNSPLILDATITSAGTAISDLKGGTIAIRVDYKTDKDLAAWFVDDAGKKTGVPCVYDGETAVISIEHCSHYVIEEGGVPFQDVLQSDYYYDAVAWAYNEGVTSGKTDYSFVPSDTCTRAEFVTFLWRAASEPYVNYAMPFTDIDEEAFYAEALRWAASEGIVQGTTATTFSPKATITRAQAVTYLWRYAGALQFTNMTANGPAPSPFSDVSNQAYYYSAVLWAKAQGITSGKTDTTFAPNENCLRCQTVVFLYNYFNK